MEALVIVGCVLIVMVVFGVSYYLGRRPKRMPAQMNVKGQDSATLAGLRQNLRLKLGYDEEKIDRLIELERQRMPNASLQTSMGAAIERWERDNR